MYFIKNYADVIIESSTEVKKDKKDNNKPVSSGSTEHDLKYIVIKGLKEEAKTATSKLLELKKPLEIVNEYLIPALDEVGEKYEKGILFLPQLIQAAETVKNSFAVLKAEISKNNNQTISKGKIIVATVKGDIQSNT